MPSMVVAAQPRVTTLVPTAIDLPRRPSFATRSDSQNVVARRKARSDVSGLRSARGRVDLVA